MTTTNVDPDGKPLHIPSAHSLAQIGHHLRWEKTTRSTGNVTTFEGVCVGVEIVPGVTFYNPGYDQSWPAVRFYLRKADGKYRWTGNLPDREPLPDDDGLR